MKTKLCVDIICLACNGQKHATILSTMSYVGEEYPQITRKNVVITRNNRLHTVKSLLICVLVAKNHIFLQINFFLE